MKSEISTPVLYCEIQRDGKFALKWQPVKDAVKYNIYYAFQGLQPEEANVYTAAERAYSGEFLHLLATVDGDVTTFADMNGDGTNNIAMDSSGTYVTRQNWYGLDNYYVTAVDAEGNESFYSLPVYGWQYAKQLPQYFDKYDILDKDNHYKLTSFPDTVLVEMADKSMAEFPINFYFKETSYGNEAIYEYQIVGTCLTGELEYVSDSRDFPAEVKSTTRPSTERYQIEHDIKIVPTNDVDTIIDERYEGSDITAEGVKYNEEDLIQYDKDQLMLRADMEIVRMLEGAYKDGYTPDDIDTYTDGTQGVSKATEYSDGRYIAIEETQVEEVNQSTLVEAQIESTRKQMKEAERQTVAETEYLIFADSAEEEYLARAMVDCQTEIDISAFPKLQNTEYLLDVLMKVIYQNPYIISPSSFSYDNREQVLEIEYILSEREMRSRQEEIQNEAKEILGQITTERMSNEEIIMAIWDYFEQNTSYDNDALEAAEANDFHLPPGFEDSFNAYGIMCNKVGVCQSYAYAFKILCEMSGVECVTLTGYLNKTLPHAWNAVELDDKWYWIDTTNNENSVGIPYWVYQTSSDFAESIDYVLDRDYALDSDLREVYKSDDKKDWYVQNGFFADNDADLVKAAADAYTEFDEIVSIKCLYEVDVDQDFMSDLADALLDAGISKNEILECRAGYSYGYFIIIKPE